MEKQEAIVHRRGVPTTGGTRSLDEDIRIISATLWPTAAEPTTATVSAADAVEASLLPPSTRLVREFPVAGLDRDYVRHLEQRIVRRPRDLTSHVRRILMLNELRDADGIAGALADLFLVLGNRGRALKARLVETVEPRLTPEYASFFSEHVDQGLSPADAMPSLARSRLSKQVGGTTRIVVTGDSPDSGAIELAKEAAKAGQNEIAQQLLEGLLDLDPGNAEVCDALLDLYERGNLRQDFFKTYTAYLGRPLAHFERWLQIAARFRDNPGGARTAADLPDLADLQ